VSFVFFAGMQFKLYLLFSVLSVAIYFKFFFSVSSVAKKGGENVGKEKGVYDLWKAVRGFNL
jgi:hypothetical protein